MALLSFHSLSRHFGAADVLVESSNHLDLPGVEVLQEALCSYNGSVLLVSHDRRLVEKVATDVYELREGRLHAAMS